MLEHGIKDLLLTVSWNKDVINRDTGYIFTNKPIIISEN